jgi:RNA polymerase sigma-70 factor, ECF subfamily
VHAEAREGTLLLPTLKLTGQTTRVDLGTLNAARSGDRAACGMLLTSLQDVWYRFALAQLRDSEMAADATQETGLRFLRQLPTFRGDSQLQTWSLGIALNVTRELRRKRGENLDSEVEAQIPAREDSFSELEQLDDRMRVQSALQQLSPRQREVLVLRYFEDLSTDETAAIMKCASGTVKATLYQALRAVKAALSSSGPIN